MFQIAIYGKGGIGKSTISANLSYQLSVKGLRCVQIGCDPKHDSTRLLLNGETQKTVLECVKESSLPEMVRSGKNGILCLETGGPEPGLGCAGRGILTAFNIIKEKDIISEDADIVLYDVLGDVVCGGFAIPLRREYADCVLIVTSGEFMSLYAANNVLRGIRNFDRDNKRVAGLIFNDRGDYRELKNVKLFAEAVDLPILTHVPRSKLFAESEAAGVTVSELYPDSPEAIVFEDLADVITDIRNGERNLFAPHPLDEDQMMRIARGETVNKLITSRHERVLALSEKEVLRGCGAAVATGIFWSIRDCDIIIHGPASCSYYFRSNHDRSTIQEKVLDRGLDRDRVFSTDLDERSFIYGGCRRLGDLLQERCQHGSSNIAVITTCVPGIIGDDVKQVCSQAGLQYPDVRIFPVIVDGILKGAAAQARKEALKQLFTVVEDETPRQQCVNIIGYTRSIDPVIRSAEDIWQIMDVLGIEVNCKVFYNNTLEEVSHLHRGSVNIMFVDNYLSRAISQSMRAELGIQTLDEPLPVGFNDCYRWIDDMATMMNIPLDRRDDAQKLIDSRRKEIESLIKPNPRRIRVILYFTINSHIGWLMDILGLMNAEVVGVYCSVVNNYQSEVSATRLDIDESIEVGYDTDFERFKSIVEKTDPDIVIGNINKIADLRTPHYVLQELRPGIGFTIECAKRINRCIRVSL